MIWTAEETEFLKNNYLVMTYEAIAKELNKTKSQVTNKINDLRRNGDDLPLHHKCAVYAYYTKGELVALGTLEEISEVTGIKANNLKFYATPSYIKRTSENSRRLVRVEGEYDYVILDRE